MDSFDKLSETERRYNQSEKGKAVIKRRNHSPEGKESRKKYLESEKGKTAQLRYYLSSKGQETRQQKNETNKVLRRWAKWKLENPEGTIEEFLKC